jgi:hypothetical protein
MESIKTYNEGYKTYEWKNINGVFHNENGHVIEHTVTGLSPQYYFHGVKYDKDIYYKHKENGDFNKFFFAQDYNLQWYMIPLLLKDMWEEYTIDSTGKYFGWDVWKEYRNYNREEKYNEDLEEFIEEFNSIFGNFKTGDRIDNIVFENPKNNR